MANRMDQGKIHEFLYNLDKSRRRLTARELAALYELAFHPDPLVRSDVAALLADHYEEQSEAILLRLTHDGDSLVRTDAADSLCIGRKEPVLQRLLNLAEHDRVKTVRGYAVHSAYDVFINLYGDSDNTLASIRGALGPMLEREEDPWVRVCYYCVLYLAGDRSLMQQLLDSLDSDDYYVRNSVLETFEDILDEENEADIEDTLQYYLPFEENQNLMLKMEDLLALIEENRSDPLF